MNLSTLLEGISVRKMFQTLYGKMVVTHDVEIRSIQYDSRRVQREDMFVAIRGTAADGHKFITQAIGNGAKVVVLEDDSVLPDSYFMHTGVVKVVVENTRVALAKLAARYYRFPAEAMTMVGVTGTNGKTTTTHLIASILQAAGRKTGLVGTIEVQIGAERMPATHTTPESLELQEMLARMAAADCSAAVMEVSSHALHQHRVDGVPFAAAVFTNLTQDHLDYHGTMEEYFKAKRVLFEKLPPTSWAVVNADDPWGGRMAESTQAHRLTFGTGPSADLRAVDIALSMRGTSFSLLHRGEKMTVESPLTGRFNVSNILAAFGTGIALEVPPATITGAIRTMGAVRGRFEQITAPAGWSAVIDYAHTPDALEKALRAVQDVMEGGRRGRIITVFGCGGNRDRTKRPLMGAIASSLSDVVVVTSDNPRREEPEVIIDEIMAGVKPGADVRREPDRAAAIALALGMALSGDVVLVAGKGHEEYQVLGETKVPFSDRAVIEAFLHSRA